MTSLKVLFAVDGSEASEAAAQFLWHLPLPFDTALRVFTVAGDPTWQVPEAIREAEDRAAARLVESWAAELEREGVRVSTAVDRGATAHKILQAAERFHADLLVVGTHGKSGSHPFRIGSVARNVASHSPVPVLVARAPRHHVARVILGVNGSGHASAAIEFMARRAPLLGETEVVVAHVARPYEAGFAPEDLLGHQERMSAARRERLERAQQMVCAAAERLEAAGRHVAATVLEGDPASRLMQLAEDSDADLIVAGARDVSLVQGLLLGSVADRLLRYAEVSVLLVH